MKVGILTWYFGANYGALAQSVGLYRAIADLGYDCKMIDYQPHNYKKCIRQSNLPSKRELYKINRVLAGLQRIKKLTRTDVFKLSEHFAKPEDINASNFDCVVLGSDAVFNVEHPLFDPIYYGVGLILKKITYSPSCEYLRADFKLSNACKESLKSMSSISVRDTNTEQLIFNNIGIHPAVTLDPTFLYDFHEFVCEIPEKRYMLIYSFSRWDEYRDSIQEYAKTNNLSIVCIGQKLEWADKSIEVASFDEWISRFRYASCVLTDSFHGTVFSLKNQKQIVLCGRDDKEAKISSLLGQFGINVKIYQGEDISEYLSQNIIDYNIANPIIESEKQKSIDYLNYALEIL